MRESFMYGSVQGTVGNDGPYRDPQSLRPDPNRPTPIVSSRMRWDLSFLWVLLPSTRPPLGG
jgi:hypothetical protein